MRAEASPLPGEGARREYLLTASGRPALVVADLPAAEPRAIAKEAERADLILWVVSATRPDRAADLAGLRALRDWAAQQRQRRTPPVLVAMTHADQLRPAAEWAPPYGPTHPKARSIAAAREAVAQALDLGLDDVLPLGLPPGGTAWGVEGLWDRVLANQDAARHARFERLLERATRSDAAAEARRAWNLGRETLRAALRRP